MSRYGLPTFGEYIHRISIDRLRQLAADDVFVAQLHPRRVVELTNALVARERFLKLVATLKAGYRAGVTP